MKNLMGNDLENCVLLVGATGRVGSMLLKCQSNGTENISLVPQTRTPKFLNEVIWDPLKGPENLMRETAESFSVKSMIILAGATPGSGKPMSLNVDIVSACLAAASKSGFKRILVASSSAIYGASNGIPFTEDAKPRPQNEYGEAKLQMEKCCEPWRKRGLEICCMRIGNVAGADALMGNFSANRLFSPLTIDLFEDGRGPIRSYIGPRTMYEVLQTLCLMKNAPPDILNLAAPVPVRMEDIADAAGQNWVGVSKKDNGSQNITLDCSVLSQLHDFDEIDSSPEELVHQWKGLS